VSEFQVARVEQGVVVNIEMVTDKWLAMAAQEEPDTQFVRFEEWEEQPHIGYRYLGNDGFEQPENLTKDPDQMDFERQLNEALAGDE